MIQKIDIFLFTSTSHLLQNKVAVGDDIGAARFLELVYGLSMIFGAIVIFMIGFLFFNTIFLNRKKASDQLLRERYQEYLADFISIPLEDELSRIGVSQSMAGLSKTDITKSDNRSLLLDELYLLHQQIDGYQAEMLKHLFWGWSMQEDVISNLKSRSKTKRIKSLDIIMEFKIEGQLNIIKPLVTSSHMDVRSQAMACLVSLTSGDLSFLKEVPLSLTDWEKHKILSAMTQLKDRQDIDFDFWAAELPTHLSFIEELRLNIKPQFQHYSNWIEKSIL